MHISILHGRFRDMGWRGVASFAKAVHEKKYHKLSMAHIRHTYSDIELPPCTGNNELYTVEHYLSDLLSRARRLDRKAFETTNSMLARMGMHIKFEQPAEE